MASPRAAAGQPAPPGALHFAANETEDLVGSPNDHIKRNFFFHHCSGSLEWAGEKNTPQGDPPRLELFRRPPHKHAASVMDRWHSDSSHLSSSRFVCARSHARTTFPPRFETGHWRRRGGTHAHEKVGGHAAPPPQLCARTDLPSPRGLAGPPSNHQHQKLARLLASASAGTITLEPCFFSQHSLTETSVAHFCLHFYYPISARVKSLLRSIVGVKSGSLNSVVTACPPSN